MPLVVLLLAHAASAAAVPTYTKDIAPLLWTRCGACHRPGAVAPFSLLEYKDVRPRAKRIADVTASRLMPPWLPEPTTPFEGERRLTGEEIALIADWISAGAPEGDPRDLPPRPVWRDGWQLGTPDLIVEAPNPYTLRPGRDDVFRNVVMRVPIREGKWVRGIEVDPGQPRVVHHAAIAIDASGESRRLDAADGEPGFSGDMIAETSARSPQGRALGWTPGLTPAFESEGMAWRLEPGSDIVLLLHLMPTATPVTLRPRIGLYFTDTPPRRVPIDFKLGSKTIDLPAGASAVVVEDRVSLPVDVELLSIYPHAHYLASRMAAIATLPDGTSRPLLSIRDWDFRWQEQYRYREPVVLPRGSVVTMRYVYDNSVSNRRNANGGLKAVHYGPRSTDEMGDLWLRLVPRDPGDAATLARAYAEHELQKDLVRLRQTVTQAPADPRARLALGVALLEAGRPEEALPHLREAVRLDPSEPLAALNLGNALIDLGEANAAVAELQRAVALAPQLPDVHNNLGIALGAAGRVDEAIAQFREALRLKPDDADARRNLDTALRLQHPR